jgi:phage tail sheath gpL-like
VSIQIVGWALSNKDPGFYAETLYGTGRMSIGAIPIKCVGTGTKTADGSMTADSSIEPCFSVDDARSLAGWRSTATQQAKAALSCEGVNFYLAPPAEANAAASATITVVFGGTYTTGGAVRFGIGGELVEVVIAIGDAVTDVGDTAVEAFGGLADGPVTGVNTAGSVALSVVSKGTQGNTYLLGWDMSQAPAGLTVAVTGGTQIHSKLVPFSGGTGTETLTAILALLKNDVYDYIAPAQTDSVSAAAIEAHVDTECSPNIAHLEHAVFGQNGTLAAAVSLAQTTLNHARCAVAWYLGTETHPAAIAANVAAFRSSVVGENPNFRYAGQRMRGIAPTRYKSDEPGSTTRQSALNSGVTPLQSKNGDVVIVRDCVSKSLNGAVPDYRTYGWPDADVPDRMRKEAAALYDERAQNNPYVGPDVASGEKSVGEGVETPSSWGSACTALWKEKEAANWITDVDANPIAAEYNYTRKCIVWAFPTVVRPQNLQMGASIRQQAA